MSLLAIEGLTVKFGGLVAVNDLSLAVEQGSIHGLIGPNGAGKTTTLRTVSGLLSPRSGAVEFLGHRIDGRPAEEIVRRGIVQSPEGRQVFPELTVAENPGSAPTPGGIAPESGRTWNGSISTFQSWLSPIMPISLRPARLFFPARVRI